MADSQEKTLALYDKRGGDFYTKAGPAAREVFGKCNVRVFSEDPVPVDLAPLRKYSHIVCHLNSGTEQEPLWLTLVSGSLEGVAVIIRVSSQGANGMEDSVKSPYRLSTTGTWILHLPERSADVSRSRWLEIFRAVKAWDSADVSISNEVGAIFDPSPESRLALRILCEAWLCTNDPTVKRSAGVPIQGPMKPEAWFAPFERKPSYEAATEIAQQMGPATEVANKFLKRIAKLASEGKDLSGPKCLHDVKDVRDALGDAVR